MAKTTILVIEELLERGDPAFLPTLRDFDDADRLAPFAPKWYTDRRPIARKFLMEYLDLPMNAYRHEPLVKRIFKLAEAAGDDVVMAGFLVMFDRSIRRRRRKRYRYDAGRYTEIEYLRVPHGTAMPRGVKPPDNIQNMPERFRNKILAFRLFSVHTRYYLRRRTWRYFRRLARQHPERYVP